MCACAPAFAFASVGGCERARMYVLSYYVRTTHNVSQPDSFKTSVVL